MLGALDFDTGDQFFGGGQEALDDHLDALGVRMDAVRLVEFRIGGDAIEEERIEEDIVFGGELGEDAVEGAGVFVAHVRWRQHAGQQDRKLALAEAGEELIRRVAGDLGVDAAERVVGAELDDDRIGIVADRPVDAGKTVARGIAGNAGIDDLDVMVARLEGALQADGEGQRPFEAETRRQAVAKSDDPDRRGGSGDARPQQGG